MHIQKGRKVIKMLHTKLLEAKKLLRDNEPPEGYYLGFSGGKDSIVLLDLAKRAKVKFDAHYSMTTIEHPETLDFVRTFPEVEIHEARKTIEELIIKKGFPPLQKYRYCTTELKVKSGRDRLKILGLRAEESKRRAELEPIVLEGKDRHIFPIFNWTTADIWQYIGKYNLRYNPLYDEGYTRVGCVLCPFAPKRQIEREIEKYPQIVERYHQACIKAYEAGKAAGKKYTTFESGDDIFEWWLSIIRRVEKKAETSGS